MSREHREAAMISVMREAARQDALHGADRNLPPKEWFVILSEEVGEVAREIQNADMVRYGVEVAQVAAVALQTLEWIHREHPRAAREIAFKIKADLDLADKMLERGAPANG